jgi:predicted DNA-binding transcriptional regulator AlpA
MPGQRSIDHETPDLFEGLSSNAKEPQTSQSDGRIPFKEPIGKSGKGVPSPKLRKKVASPAPKEERFLRDIQVAERYNVCRQTVWRWSKNGKLPTPAQLSSGVSRWRLSDLISHEASFKASRTKGVGKS